LVEAISTKFERGIDVRHLSLFFAKRITEVIYKSVDAGCHMSARWEHEGQACKRSDRLFEKCDYLPAHNFRLTQPLLRQPNSKTIQNQISYKKAIFNLDGWGWQALFIEDYAFEIGS